MLPKFRAWDKKTKEYFHISELWNSGTAPECFHFDGWTDNFGGKGRLKDIVIEQSTGLKDVNGKDIYEGDIVTVQATNDDGSTDGMLGKIVYDEDIASFEFTTTGKDGWYTSSFDNLFEEGFFDIHVIGNAHENPELLEEK